MVDQVCQRARDMARAASGAGYKVEQAKQQRDQIRDRLQTRQQQHEQLRKSWRNAVLVREVKRSGQTLTLRNVQGIPA